MPWISGAIIAGGALIGGRQDRKANVESQALNYDQQKEFAQNQIQWRTEDAQAAGVHPLYAMGASTSSFQPAYQTGSSPGNAIRGAARGLAKSQEDWLQAQIENTKAKTAEIRANATQSTVLPIIEEQKQEIKKGEVDPYVREHPEQNLSTISPMTNIRMGSQTIKVPVKDMETVIEDPLTVAIATYFYQGNKNVDWGKAANDYVGMKKSRPWKRKVISYIARNIAKLRAMKKPKSFYSPSIPKPRRR